MLVLSFEGPLPKPFRAGPVLRIVERRLLSLSLFISSPRSLCPLLLRSPFHPGTLVHKKGVVYNYFYYIYDYNIL